MTTSRPEQIVYAEHASDIIAKAAELSTGSQRFTLISSLAIEGGAAREPGSLALVDENGEMFGYLSNGCIDRDIRHHALAALETNKSRLIRYGNGSRYMDLKLPCGGALSVLIDPVPDHQAIRQAALDLAARRVGTLTFRPPADDLHDIGPRRFFYTPHIRLVIAGRGAVFRAMAQAGDATGFELGLMSPDADDLEAVRALNPAEMHHLTSPSDCPDLSGLDPYSAFLTLFHDHDWEPHILKAALQTPAFFVGSLGSRRSHHMRLGGLAALGVPEENLARLKGPIGLVPSLRNASFIAVSTLAQVIAELPPQTSEAQAKDYY